MLPQPSLVSSGLSPFTEYLRVSTESIYNVLFFSYLPVNSFCQSGFEAGVLKVGQMVSSFVLLAPPSLL